MNYFGVIDVNRTVQRCCFKSVAHTEGNEPAKSFSHNPNRIISYGKIWIFVNKMNVFWVI